MDIFFSYTDFYTFREKRSWLFFILANFGALLLSNYDVLSLLVRTPELDVYIDVCLSTTKPDVILMDIRMPKMDGVLATKVIKEKFPNIKVIILTTFDDDDFIYSALKYGASGLILNQGKVKPTFKTYNKVLEEADYLITKSIANNTIEIDLFNIQKTIEDDLKQ